jgi:uncharacterized protein YdhG (YjbR/CyaY superfamily)
MDTKACTTIDEYISACPKPVQARLQEIRRIVHKAAPEAQERISYRMPAFTLDGNLVYFAAFANHIGFYPIPSGVEKFKAELAKFKTSKGGVQFPLDEPLPGELIRKIVVFRAAENRKKMKARKGSA